MEERWMRDKVPYPQWAKEGFIELTPGDAIDYDYIESRIVELATVYDIRRSLSTRTTRSPAPSILKKRA